MRPARVRSWRFPYPGCSSSWSVLLAVGLPVGIRRTEPCPLCARRAASTFTPVPWRLWSARGRLANAEAIAQPGPSTRGCASEPRAQSRSVATRWRPVAVLLAGTNGFGMVTSVVSHAVGRSFASSLRVMLPQRRRAAAASRSSHSRGLRCKPGVSATAAGPAGSGSSAPEAQQPGGGIA